MTVQDSSEKFLLSIKTLPYWVAKNNHFYLDVNVKTSLIHDSDRCYLTYDIKIQVSDLNRIYFENRSFSSSGSRCCLTHKRSRRDDTVGESNLS